jgi:hypothetical protein
MVAETVSEILKNPEALEKKIHAVLLGKITKVDSGGLSPLSEILTSEESYKKELEILLKALLDSKKSNKLYKILDKEEAKKYIQSIRDAIAFSEQMIAAYKDIFKEPYNNLFDFQNKMKEFTDKFEGENGIIKMMPSVEFHRKFSKNNDQMEKLKKLIKSYQLAHKVDTKISFDGYGLLPAQRFQKYGVLFKAVHDYCLPVVEESSSLQEEFLKFLESKNMGKNDEKDLKQEEQLNKALDAHIKDYAKEKQKEQSWFSDIKQATQKINNNFGNTVVHVEQRSEAEKTRQAEIVVQQTLLRKYLKNGSGVDISNVSLGFDYSGFLKSVLKNPGDGFSCARKGNDILVIKLNGCPLIEISVDRAFYGPYIFEKTKKRVENIFDKTKKQTQTISIRGVVTKDVTQFGEHVTDETVAKKITELTERLFFQIEAVSKRIPLVKKVGNEVSDKSKETIASGPIEPDPVESEDVLVRQKAPYLEELVKKADEYAKRREEKISQPLAVEPPKVEKKGLPSFAEAIERAAKEKSSNASKAIEALERNREEIDKAARQKESKALEDKKKTPPSILGPKPPRVLPVAPVAGPKVTEGTVTATWRKNIAPGQALAGGPPPYSKAPEIPVGRVADLAKKFENLTALPPLPEKPKSEDKDKKGFKR